MTLPLLLSEVRESRLPASHRPDLRPAWRDVDLDALEANYRLLRQVTAPAEVLAVVKADAYGHGAVEVALALEGAGATWFAVALVEEGAELRRGGVRGRILVFVPAAPEQMPLFRRYGLTACISSEEQLRSWLQWTAASGLEQEVHLKVDTGMSRLGVPAERAAGALDALRGAPGLRLGGLFSHLAEADDLESGRNAEQGHRFSRVLDALTAEEKSRLWIHCANSAGALHHPQLRHKLVRAGLALFGHDPARRRGDLRPVLTLRGQLVAVRDVAAGDRVGYGGRFVADRPRRIGVVPIGYADGYGTRFGGAARALLRGRFVPVVGSVSMDMLAVDLTGGAGEVGDEVVLLGRQAAEEIGLDELAVIAGELRYELLCSFGLRLARRYHRDGRPVAIRSRHDPEHR